MHHGSLWGSVRWTPRQSLVKLCLCGVCLWVCLSPEGRKRSSRTPGIEASSQRHAVLRGSLFIPLHCLLGDTSSLSSSSAQIAGKWASCLQGTTSGWCTTAEEGLGLTWRCSRMKLPLLIIYVCTLFSHQGLMIPFTNNNTIWVSELPRKDRNPLARFLLCHLRSLFFFFFSSFRCGRYNKNIQF